MLLIDCVCCLLMVSLLFVDCCWLRAVSWRFTFVVVSFVVRCLLFVVCCCCSLLALLFYVCVMFGDFCGLLLMCVACCSLFVVCCLIFVECRSLIVVCCFLFFGFLLAV